MRTANQSTGNLYQGIPDTVTHPSESIVECLTRSPTPHLRFTPSATESVDRPLAEEVCPRLGRKLRFRDTSHTVFHSENQSAGQVSLSRSMICFSVTQTSFIRCSVILQKNQSTAQVLPRRSMICFGDTRFLHLTLRKYCRESVQKADQDSKSVTRQSVVQKADQNNKSVNRQSVVQKTDQDSRSVNRQCCPEVLPVQRISQQAKCCPEVWPVRQISQHSGKVLSSTANQSTGKALSKGPTCTENQSTCR